MRTGQTDRKFVVTLTCAAIVLAVAILAFPVQAAPSAQSEAAARKPHKKNKGDKTLGEMAEYVLARGTETYCPAIILRHLDFPGEMPCNYIEASTQSVTDGLGRSFIVILHESTAGKALVPYKLQLETDYSWNGNGEGYQYRASLDGTLEKAIVIAGKEGVDGRGVKGSGVVSEKDIDSPEIKERFRHELDFWLKDAYRKKKDAASGSPEHPGGKTKLP